MQENCKNKVLNTNFNTLQKQSLDILDKNPLLLERIQIDTKLSKDEIPLLFAEMLQFLHISAKSNFSTVPSEMIDKAWHEFILFTKEYTNYCNDNFGFYLHHTPGKSSDTEDRYKKTLKIIKSKVGNPKFFGSSQKSANNTAYCGCDGGNTVRAIANCGCDGGNS